MHLYEVLRRPLITEKNTMLQTQNKYAFEVVNVMTVPGKTKRVGRRMVLTPSRKKAIVTLKQGDKIELFEGV